MPKVTVVQVIYNSRSFIKPIFEAIFAQTFKDIEVVAVISGNQDRGKEFLMEKFPLVEIIDPGFNIGFAKGHNLVFEKYHPEFFQLVNPDMIMEPNYIEEILKAFQNPKVGAATGKLYKIPESGIRNYKLWKTENLSKAKILDTTGIAIYKSGRGRDRGQHEIDNGQYDKFTAVDAVSGAGCMYRRSALLSVKLRKIGKSENRNWDQYDLSGLRLSEFEFFDEDFHSYWEDVDLSWRMANRAWKNVFAPSAIGYHGRAAGSSEKGYADFSGFIKHHRALPERIRQLNYKNHIYMYVKNSPLLYPQFFLREFFMLFYILLFEPSTLKILPIFFKQLPKIWKKRKLIFQ